jgi:hypothetical protein
VVCDESLYVVGSRWRYSSSSSPKENRDSEATQMEKEAYSVSCKLLGLVYQEVPIGFSHAVLPARRGKEEKVWLVDGKIPNILRLLYCYWTCYVRSCAV